MERKERYRYGAQRSADSASKSTSTGNVMEEIERLVGREQYRLATRMAFERSLHAYMDRFGRQLDQSETYREFIAKQLSAFTKVDSSFMIMNGNDAHEFIYLLRWDTGPGKEEFDAIIALSKMYFEVYEPLTFDDTSAPDPQRIMFLMKQAYAAASGEM